MIQNQPQITWRSRITSELLGTCFITSSATQLLTFVPSVAAKVATNTMFELTKQFDRPFNSRALSFATQLIQINPLFVGAGLNGIIMNTDDPCITKIAKVTGIVMASLLTLPGYSAGEGDGANLGFRIGSTAVIVGSIAGYSLSKLLGIGRDRLTAPRLIEIDPYATITGVAAGLVISVGETLWGDPKSPSSTLLQISCIASSAAAICSAASKFFSRPGNI